MVVYCKTMWLIFCSLSSVGRSFHRISSNIHFLQFSKKISTFSYLPRENDHTRGQFSFKNSKSSQTADGATHFSVLSCQDPPLQPSKQSLLQEIQEALTDWPDLCRRRWVPVQESPKAAQGPSLTILQWNVLSDGLSGKHPTLGGFIRAPPGSLEWDLRKYRILEEILRWDADILCLQEVDHYDDWFLPNLSKLGYAGIFSRKPASAGLQYSNLADGCAIFYLKHKLELKSSVSSVYNVRQPNGVITASNQVYIIAEFNVKGTNNEREEQPVGEDLILGCTHLKADKTLEGEQIRAMQAKQLLDEIFIMQGNVLEENSKGKDSNQKKKTIICGDFNATPLKQRSYPTLCYPLCITHPLGIISTFQDQEQLLLDSEQIYTTWKVRPNLDGTERHVKNCLDYIFFSKNIKPLELASIPTEEDGIDSHFTPSFSYPSDHFALVSKLCLQQ